jgi:hypothetical protein
MPYARGGLEVEKIVAQVDADLEDRVLGDTGKSRPFNGGSLLKNNKMVNSHFQRIVSDLG